MYKPFDLISLGEIMLRLTAPQNERLVKGSAFMRQAGSAELNVAAGASLLGLKTAIISKLPENDMGNYIKNCVQSCGVSSDYLIFDPSADARLGVYYYEFGASPRKPKVTYDRMNSSINKLEISDLPEDIFTSARCFHTSGISLALSADLRRTVIEIIRRFKEGGALISFDVNYRANLWSGQEAKETIETILPYVDYFFCSEDTARLTFLKEGQARDIMRNFADEYHMSVVASTRRIVHSPRLHTFDSLVYDVKNDQFYEEEPYRDIEIVDRLGSGDAYLAGALYGLLSEDGCCRKALEFGNAASAVKNTTMGDLPLSDLKELKTIIECHHSDLHLEMDR
ncbi:sugar kinase [Clostridium sp. AM58-1XD]|uniref:sugar kinase n=1 Tax=Clostridium sp. AM58-1XD TaxID=2292307 RepID=UPI000E4F4D58|nr:sugar kinase [Clostridium sp. AM58-1XD]RGY97842.1 sugar kinase [Clostridium sp. AM58-1XD]